MDSNSVSPSGQPASRRLRSAVAYAQTWRVSLVAHRSTVIVPWSFMRRRTTTWSGEEVEGIGFVNATPRHKLIYE